MQKEIFLKIQQCLRTIHKYCILECLNKTYPKKDYITYFEFLFSQCNQLAKNIKNPEQSSIKTYFFSGNSYLNTISSLSSNKKRNKNKHNKFYYLNHSYLRAYDTTLFVSKDLDSSLYQENPCDNLANLDNKSSSRLISAEDLLFLFKKIIKILEKDIPFLEKKEAIQLLFFQILY